MTHSNKIIMDLDGVIAGPKPSHGTYLDCEPNKLVIQRLRELQAEGYVIAIYTSRQVRTHDHNAGAIIAETVPKAIEWLNRHNVPFDEIWPAKPWAGADGIYVDDRAVRPNEFVSLSMLELKRLTAASSFDVETSKWRAESKQAWQLVDLRAPANLSMLGAVKAIVEAGSKEGLRTVLAVGSHSSVEPGHAEELDRLGVIVTRESADLDQDTVVELVTRDLHIKNLGSEVSLVDLQPTLGAFTLSSRHFNNVKVNKERTAVTKTANDEDTLAKLRFEQCWLSMMRDSTPGGVSHDKKGYSLQYAKGGSLANFLAYRALSDTELSIVSNRLTLLYTLLTPAKSDMDASLISPKDLDQEGQRAEYVAFIYQKSLKRLEQLDKLLVNINAGSVDTAWIVNGEVGPNIRSVVNSILQELSIRQDRGPWHGDFCPGNIVLTNSSLGKAEFKLIDPRGTVDGKKLAIYGDRRYDKAKLAHSLWLGYDTIVNGWRDVHWHRPSPSAMRVDFRLWDEHDSHDPNRLRLLATLNRGEELCLDQRAIKQLAILQIITCAPLHSDDPDRVVTLVARGLEAYMRGGL